MSGPVRQLGRYRLAQHHDGRLARQLGRDGYAAAQARRVLIELDGDFYRAVAAAYLGLAAQRAGHEREAIVRLHPGGEAARRHGGIAAGAVDVERILGVELPVGHRDEDQAVLRLERIDIIAELREHRAQGGLVAHRPDICALVFLSFAPRRPRGGANGQDDGQCRDFSMYAHCLSPPLYFQRHDTTPPSGSQCRAAFSFYGA